MYKIALVEDEVDLNNLIKTYLIKNNYDVVSYTKGIPEFCSSTLLK